MIPVSGHFVTPNKEQMASSGCVLMRGACRGMRGVIVTGHDWLLIQPRIKYDAAFFLNSACLPVICTTSHGFCALCMVYLTALSTPHLEKTNDYTHCHQGALFVLILPQLDRHSRELTGNEVKYEGQHAAKNKCPQKELSHYTISILNLWATRAKEALTEVYSFSQLSYTISKSITCS